MEKDTSYITLGQFLKLENYVSSGGEAKHLIHTFDIRVNGEVENRRGRKLYAGDVVEVNGDVYTIADDSYEIEAS